MTYADVYKAGLEAAAAYCGSHIMATPYRHTAPLFAGYVSDPVTPADMGGMRHHGMGYAAAIRALPVPAADDEAMVERMIADMEDMRLALADAIRRPMGVVPASAERFVTAEDLAEAEARRAALAAMREGEP